MKKATRTFGALPNSDFRAAPLWWEDTPPWDAEGERPVRCDVAIVGGGIAGLSAGLELASAGLDAVVLEADQIGSGASTRNSGGISIAIRTDRIPRARGDAYRMEAIRAGFESMAQFEDSLQRFGIECDYRVRGRFVGAHTPAAFEALSRRAEETNRAVDAGAHLVPRERQREEIDSRWFFGGMVVERSGQVHPGRYHRGLANAFMSRGGRLLSSQPVRSIAREVGTFVLGMAGWTLKADNVVIATNGVTGNLVPWLRRGVIPVASHIIVTEPLPAETAAALIPKRRTGSDTRRLLCYFRFAPDGKRLIFGGRAAPLEVSPEHAAAVLYREMVRLFPQLDAVRISHSWGGYTAFTLDGVPHMGGREGLYFCTGCNGNGIAMMTHLGRSLARKLIDRVDRTCVFDDAKVPSLPFYKGTPWFLPAVAGCYRLLDRIDALRNRRCNPGK